MPCINERHEESEHVWCLIGILRITGSILETALLTYFCRIPESSPVQARLDREVVGLAVFSTGVPRAAVSLRVNLYRSAKLFFCFLSTNQ
jgi:hypothetical protein